ncbi:MAG TPA: AAA family ATPase [Candidatus Nitrosocosmicus sp.]
MDSDYLDNIFEKAVFGISLIKNRKTLTIDYVPEKLPFRDEESKTIAQVLSVVLKNGRPSNLLVFGKPGTGKTAVVKNVINRLKKISIQHGIEITVTIVNAKTSNTSYKVLYDIAENLGTNKIDKKFRVHFTGLSMGEATDRILEYIKKNKLHVLLVIDEIDSLVERNGDDILYSFTRANERLLESGFISLIGISNSLTFKDKLDPRVRSSLSEEELIFNPYTVLQLKEILYERSQLAFNEGAISPASINLCAAVAGKDNGDARKAIDLLRVAAELAERERATIVIEKHIRDAQEKIEKDSNYEVIKNSTTHTKLVVLSILKSQTGMTGDVYDIYISLCKRIQHDTLTQRRITQIVSELDQLGLITSNVVSHGRYGRSQIIKVAVSTNTITDALKDDTYLSALL